MHNRGWVFFIIICSLVVCTSGLEALDTLEQMVGPALTVFEYSNPLAKEIIHKSYGSSHLSFIPRCEIAQMACLIAKSKIFNGTTIVRLSPQWSITKKTVLTEYPSLVSLLSQEDVLPFISPEILFTIYLWGQSSSKQSLPLSLLEAVTARTYFQCTSHLASPVCTPHLWKQQELLYPSRIKELIDAEKEYIQDVFSILNEKVFPEIPDMQTSRPKPEKFWLELFLTVRMLTFIRPYDQEEVFFYGLAGFSHNPDSTITVKWTKESLDLIADKTYFQGQEISINYWELLGSLSSLTKEEDLAAYGVDMEQYRLERQVVLSSEKMLLHFGQLPKNNRNNTHIIIKTKLKFDDRAVEAMLKDWVEKIPFIKDGVAEFRLEPNAFPDAFMTVSRLVSLRLEDLVPNIKEVIASGEVVNIENEARAMSKVFMLLEQTIESYDTPEEYIEEITSIYHSKMNRETQLRLRLHYFELQNLRAVEYHLFNQWNQYIFEGGYKSYFEGEDPLYYTL